MGFLDLLRGNVPVGLAIDGLLSLVCSLCLLCLFNSIKNLYTGSVIGGYMVQSSKLLKFVLVIVLVGGFQTHYTGFARKNMIGVGKNSWSFPKYWTVLQLRILLSSKPKSRLSGLCHSMNLPKLELI